ncbi:MAG TPA: HAD-IA family hydrolase [Patescibacteria group bacterium]|nr:HAD-IA family hydrolase [Patescibacteria group bacterium]
MIKFIYFDVGGVVIKDFSGTNKWIELQRGIGIKPEQDQEFVEFFDKYEPEVCLGRNIETLVPLMKKKFGLKLPKDYSFLKDFVDRFEKNESIWPVIEKAKSKFGIGLLTNMYTNMLGLVKKRGLLPNIDWDVVIDSSVEKVIKPTEAIFKLAQERSGVNVNEIMFVENGKKHVEAAKAFGWQTFLYDSTNLEDSSKNLLNSLSSLQF